MNLDLETNHDHLTFTLHPETPLSHVSFGFETGAMWFMGRGVFALEFSRRQVLGSSGREIDYIAHDFITRPLIVQKPYQWSNAVTLASLAREKQFPLGLFARWEAQEGETLIELQHLHDQTIGYLAYGLSDLVTSIFLLGATSLRVQYSQNLSQILFNRVLTKAQKMILFSEGIDGYNDSHTVANLPWP